MTDQAEAQTQPNPTCKYCQGTDVVKYGTYKGAQRYFCRACKRKFKGDDSLFHSKASASMIASALNMYYMGMSINDIRSYVKQDTGYYPSKSVIYDWVNRFSQRAIAHFKDYQPEVGDTWLLDETMVEVEGHKVWFYDLIDEKTRYLLASHLATKRYIGDARITLAQAAKVAGKRPKVIITDSLESYPRAIGEVFGDAVRHIQYKGITKPPNNNILERFYGTLKERTKVMRGLKDWQSAQGFLRAFAVYYNFFKPHEAFNGGTPAEAAHIDYPVKNWADLSRLPVAKGANIDDRPNLPKELRYREPNISRLLGQPTEKQVMRMLGATGGNRRFWR